jgi:tetratricopeptide (TPR) repeat protein
MQKRGIEDLVYILKNININDENVKKPIVFIGAGASASAGIPLTSEIINTIILEYGEKPSIKCLCEDDKGNYYKLMGALSPNERRNLFKKFINNENVRINITHIYLAQLLVKGYIDYIFTPNFDDLMLKACALFNFIPPVYDVSNLKDFTTTNFQNQSITYLHGQHHGQWLLNAKGELDKVKGIIPKLFNRVCDGRTWIIIGYSGEDEVLDELAKFESFDNELYWVGYKNNEPSERVKEKLLDIDNKNSYYVSGFDSDSFLLNLHSELRIDTPEILNKPFSFLKGIINNVKDVSEYEENGHEHKEKFKSLKERMDISVSLIDKAILEFEDSVEKFKQEIIEAYLKEDFDSKEKMFLGKIKLEQFNGANIELADFYNQWGNSIYSLAMKKKEITLYNRSIEKYEKAIKYNKNFDWAYNNWALALSNIAELSKDPEIFKESFKKSKIATEINPKYGDAYMNWGFNLNCLAELLNDEKMFLEGFKKYEIASKFDEKSKFLYSNWTSSLSKYALLLPVEKRESIYFLTLEKAKLDYEISSNSYNLACCYSLLKDKVNALKYLDESLEKKLIAKFKVIKDTDWDFYREDEDFLALLNKY